MDTLELRAQVLAEEPLHSSGYIRKLLRVNVALDGNLNERACELYTRELLLFVLKLGGCSGKPTGRGCWR